MATDDAVLVARVPRTTILLELLHQSPQARRRPPILYPLIERRVAATRPSFEYELRHSSVSFAYCAILEFAMDDQDLPVIAEFVVRRQPMWRFLPALSSRRRK